MHEPTTRCDEPRVSTSRAPGGERMEVLLRGAVFLFLLVLPVSATGQTDEEIEAVFWRSVECESARQVQAYLEVYSTGRYVAEAWACLEGQLGLDRAARKLVQQGLTALEYAVGAADGLFGPATRKALREWQAGKGFVATGYLTRAQADTLMAQGREAVAEQRQAQAEAERKRQEEEAERRRAAGAERQAREEAARAEAERQRQAQEAAAQAEAERQRQTCAGRSEGAECWMELSDRPRCHVLTARLAPGESMAWTGECSDGVARGMGTLIRAWTDGESMGTGLMRDGKRYGPWVGRWKDGGNWEGTYIDGKMHGRWIQREADGTIHEGPYVNGKRHGHWVQRFASGNVWEGPYVEGKIHGRWVGRLANGDVKELIHVNGEQQGQ